MPNLINPSGRVVAVASERVDTLLQEGFTPAPDEVLRQKEQEQTSYDSLELPSGYHFVKKGAGWYHVFYKDDLVGKTRNFDEIADMVKDYHSGEL